MLRLITMLLGVLIVLANLPVVCVSHVEHIITVKGEVARNIELTDFEGVDESLSITLLEIKTDEKYKFVTYDSLGVSKNEFWHLVWTMAAEARGESYEGRKWVVYTIMNRVSDSRFPNTINEVLTAPNQFSGRRVKNYGVYNPENVQDVIDALTDWNNGLVDKRVLFFNAYQDVSESYAEDNGLELVKEIGNHRFYKLKGE